jgi:hypothetical protein
VVLVPVDGEFGAVRDFEFQHHDGDEDGDEAVAECFQAAFARYLFLHFDVYYLSPSLSDDIAGYYSERPRHEQNHLPIPELLILYLRVLLMPLVAKYVIAARLDRCVRICDKAICHPAYAPCHHKIGKKTQERHSAVIIRYCMVIHDRFLSA